MKYNKGSFAVVPNVDRMRELSHQAFKVFVALCKFTDNKNMCFPSRKRLSEMLNMTPNYVTKFIKELVDRGWIERTTRTREDGSQTSSMYTIQILPPNEFVNWHVEEEKEPETTPPPLQTVHEGGNRQSVRGVTDSVVAINYTKEHTIEHTISKDIEQSLESELVEAKPVYGNQDINWVMETFERIRGFKSAGKKDRFMAKHLLNNFNRDQIQAMLMWLDTTAYAPRVGSVADLWHSRGKIIAGIKAAQAKKQEEQITILGLDDSQDNSTNVILGL